MQHHGSPRTYNTLSSMDDFDDDDIYGSGEAGAKSETEVKMEDVEDGEEEGEEVEEDSDDDINFITDSKEEPKKPDTPSQSIAKPTKPQAVKEERKNSSTPQPTHRGSQSREIKVEVQTPSDDKPGTEYPARHTSKLDPNGNPIHSSTGNPILSTDFDTDFPTESTKPWRKPGADISDYFNYGFDEFTWASYCLKQQQMPKEIKEINNQAEQMKAFVEGIPGGSMPGMGSVPTGPAAAGANMNVPGMPSEQEMGQMFQAMMSQGMDPSQMDPSQMMQFYMGAGGGGGMPGSQPPSGPQGGYGDGGFGQGGVGGGGGGYGGRGRGRRGRGNW